MSKRPTLISASGGPLLNPKMMPDGSSECIELLTDMLESAKAGNMSWLVVVAGGPADYGVAFAGSNGAQMNLGIDVAKKTILDRVSVK
jgi:hypothetical protein